MNYKYQNFGAVPNPFCCATLDLRVWPRAGLGPGSPARRCTQPPASFDERKGWTIRSQRWISEARARSPPLAGAPPGAENPRNAATPAFDSPANQERLVQLRAKSASRRGGRNLAADPGSAARPMQPRSGKLMQPGLACYACPSRPQGAARLLRLPPLVGNPLLSQICEMCHAPAHHPSAWRSRKFTYPTLSCPWANEHQGGCTWTRSVDCQRLLRERICTKAWRWTCRCGWLSDPAQCGWSSARVELPAVKDDC